jgi:small subunit ribosomal protein S24e
MDMEIKEKKNNPLLNRTEIHFIINHEGEVTPNREIIRTEIADKLNVKKENIIINNLTSKFGIQKTIGYAKIYSNPKKAEAIERKYILNRNQKIQKDKKKEEDKKKEVEKKESEPSKAEDKIETTKEEDKTKESINQKEETENTSKDKDIKDDKSKSEESKPEEKKE